MTNFKTYTIGEICYIKRGRVISKEYLAENKGEFPVYSSQTFNNGEIGRIKTYDFDGEYLTWTTDGAYAGSVFYRNGKFSATNICGLLKVKKPDEVSAKFLSYLLQIKTKDYVNQEMGNPKLMSNVMEKIEVSIPPLPTQLKIVEILDKFTELQTELQKELKLRKKQYEYYRDKLLTFSEEERERWGVRDVRIGDVCMVVGRIGFRGYTRQDQVKQGEGAISLSPANIEGTRLNYDNCTYITWEKYEESPEIMVKNGDIVFCKTASVGKTAFVENLPQEATINPQFILLKNIKCDAKYLSYLLQSTMFQKAVEKIKSLGTIHTFSQKDFNNLYIEIPSITSQKEIVEILDKFDTLVNDISNGLPREIELRKKQYEYYREKLVSFG